MRAALLALLMGIGGAEASAQSPTELIESDCYDDNMVDRCASSVQQEVRSRFELQSVEQLNAANIQARRAFFVDGHGNDLPVVSFERMPNEPPQVRVSVIVAESGARRVVRLNAPVALAAWDDVIARSRYFDRRLVEQVQPTEDASPPGTIRLPPICLHSWVVSVEASDPGGATPTRSATQDACNDGLVIPYAERMATLAVDAIPACSGIRAEAGRSPIIVLSLCGLLDGDTISAGEALNQAMELRFAANASGLLIHDGAEIDWQGQTVLGFDVVRAWPSLIGSNLLQYHRVSGSDSSHVTIAGEIVEYERNVQGYPRHRTAHFEQTWVRENGFDFRLRAMRVHPWRQWTR